MTALTPNSFPVPDDDALAASETLRRSIVDAVDTAGGWISFETFMQAALYTPGLGYYSGGSNKFGSRGDFTTGPELGDWLARAMAALLARQFNQSGPAGILELGAGTGRLAADLLDRLAEQGYENVDYAILEVSAELRERQASLLRRRQGRVRWLDQLPETPSDCFVIANEVADALTVQRFVKADGVTLPLGVTLRDGGLALAPGPADRTLSQAVAGIEAAIGHALPDGYRSEVCLILRPWLASVLAAIDRGGLLLIDYGMPRRDFYREERSDGTLICHYQHRAHTDALLWPGLQDISAWVDFTAAAEAGRANGFDVSGFTTQAQFLVESIASEPALAARRPTAREASALQTLILPGEMGERFKLLWLTRGIEPVMLPGRDFRNWL